MDLLAAHRSAVSQFDARVGAIHDSQWGSATPDTQWDVRDLVNHLVSEQLWVPPLMAGRTIGEVGDQFDGDVLGDDPRAEWATASAGAVGALAEPGAVDRTVHLSFGDTTAADYIGQLTLDLTVHAWDLARAIGYQEEMPNDLVAVILETAKGFADRWEGGEIFAPPIPVPGCTDDLTELLALLGRRR